MEKSVYILSKREKEILKYIHKNGAEHKNFKELFYGMKKNNIDLSELRFQSHLRLLMRLGFVHLFLTTTLPKMDSEDISLHYFGGLKNYTFQIMLSEKGIRRTESWQVRTRYWFLENLSYLIVIPLITVLSIVAKDLILKSL